MLSTVIIQYLECLKKYLKPTITLFSLFHYHLLFISNLTSQLHTMNMVIFLLFFKLEVTLYIIF